MRRAALLFICAVGGVLTACGWGTGSSFMAEPLVPSEEPGGGGGGSAGGRGRARPQSRTIGDHPAPKENGIAGNGSLDKTGGGGRVLGTFRNTYYDFPSEKAFQGSGPQVSLMNAKCEPIAQVPRGFFEAACVQGSGSLARGGTVSFAKRDCACAEVCPRTNQKICFDTLDRQTYPWGRGASGNPISPLRSIAADVSVLAMGTVVYIPELDGIEGSDGCFVVEDRGLKVQGEHVDIFTGDPSRTAALNAQVPSNHGVTIVVDAPACGRLTKR